jgi:hypothetical protein
MALFALFFLVVMLILIGVGIVVGVVLCCVAAFLCAVGVISSSVVIGVVSRRPSAAVRAFLFQCALIAGIPSGILCAWIAHSVFSVSADVWLISLYGVLGGAVAGLIIALLLDFISRRVQRWASAKLGRGSSSETVTPVV